MPSEAVSLALAASIYPPALAVVIALGRGTEVRLRVLLLVVGAFFTVLVTGSLMLLLFTEVGASSKPARTASAGLYIAAGAALIWLAVRLRNRDPDAPKAETGPSKTDRYLESARLVLVLGVVLYVIPSPIYMGVVKAIADTHASTAQQLVYLVEALLIMLWMIEIPMLLLLAFPARGSRVLEGVNAWFARNGRLVAVLVAAGAGLYLIGVGLVELV
jgi:Sap, sulfolipid-1-addressing protein